MKKVLAAMLVATMLLLALSVAEDATKSTTVATTSTTPGSDATKSTTTATPGFEAIFAVAGLLAVTFVALRRKR
jgi:PGF-CTERM protein